MKLTHSQYQCLLKELNKSDRRCKLYLTRGNCGIYAMALQKFLGEGELVGYVRGLEYESYDNVSFSHVLLRVGTTYFDGYKIFESFEEMDAEWGEDEEYATQEEFPDIFTEEIIVEGTDSSKTVKYMLRKIKELVKKTP